MKERDDERIFLGLQSERRVPQSINVSSGFDAQTSSPASPGGWRGKVSLLEEELKAKAEIVARLRQRELWFEQQLRRQKESNDMPLEALLLELRGLQEASDRLTLQAAERRFP